MFEITIRDKETGEVKTYEAAIFQCFFKESDGIISSGRGKGTPIDFLDLLLSADSWRDDLFRRHPLVKAAYEHRAEIGRGVITMDLQAMEQMKGGQA